MADILFPIACYFLSISPLLHSYEICFQQCLIKKDREDQNDPAMSEFYDKLTNAYNDPALMPIKYPGGFSSGRSPLLQRPEV